MVGWRAVFPKVHVCGGNVATVTHEAEVLHHSLARCRVAVTNLPRPIWVAASSNRHPKAGEGNFLDDISGVALQLDLAAGIAIETFVACTVAHYIGCAEHVIHLIARTLLQLVE